MVNKTIMTNVIGGIIILVLSAGGTWLTIRVDEGGEALEQDKMDTRIKLAIDAALMTPEGETYGAVLSRIDKEIVKINTTMGILLATD